MNKITIKRILNRAAWPIVLVTIIGAFLGSCSKTEDVLYEKEPTNSIIEYKVINAAEGLYGVVDDINNSITVYIPYYISIDYLVPTIKLKDGANLIDKDGNEIDLREDLEPVPFDSVGYKYRVKDENDLVREYTLEIEILPYSEPLVLGYAGKLDENRNWVIDDKATKQGIINSRINIFGNFYSTSRNAKLSLIDIHTKAVVPNALTLYNLVSGSEFYTLSVDISPDVDPGDYYIAVEQQGRKDTLPTIHLDHKLPYFGPLPKLCKQGEEITLNVYGPTSSGEVYSGSNPGIKKAYILLNKNYLQQYPESLPQSLLDKPIELEIIKQDRISVTFRFPEVIPAGMYYSTASFGSGIYEGYTIQYTGFGVYFDFDYKDWATGNLRAMGNVLGQEVGAK